MSVGFTDAFRLLYGWWSSIVVVTSPGDVVNADSSRYTLTTSDSSRYGLSLGDSVRYTLVTSESSRYGLLLGDSSRYTLTTTEIGDG